ncbi:CaiB/BaiF CoA transferase family protein [Mycobacterium malmoense]|uniref:CaiB/BaiF CoA transferase family protein n=1 Tax=Mycobacterium malmoense TaxID=1780 RepID=UPI000A9B835C|nr:CaiB/BaiF CoA-transferase family protein [Mycobacterium malmoense]
MTDEQRDVPADVRNASVPPGPLSGVRVIEMDGIGPGPVAAMMLADLGADVVRIRRPSGGSLEFSHRELLYRGKRLISMDVKKDPAALLDLIARADVLIDPFRPGTAERLGVGPSDCSSVNPRLIYARITGWGQDGPLATSAGHDINYLAHCGVLNAIGYRDQPPVPPLNMVADYGGGTMFLVAGICAALYERERSGQGQVIDAAMVDGVCLLAQAFWAMRSVGQLPDERQSSLLDGGTPFYRTYETADHKYVAVGPIEPQFYQRLVEGLGLSMAELPDQWDVDSYGHMHRVFAERFASKTRAEWMAVFTGTDACVAPVLTWTEAIHDEHLRARETLIHANGFEQAAPAPRFSRTPGRIGPLPTEVVSPEDIDW